MLVNSTVSDVPRRPAILGLPPELLHNIVCETAPGDLGRLCLTCRSFNELIKHNTVLYRGMYLRNFARPCLLADDHVFPWEQELQNNTKLEKLLQSESKAAKIENVEHIVETISKLVQVREDGQTLTRNVPFVAKHFEREANVDALLCGSSLFDLASSASDAPTSTHFDNEAKRQLSAKLHCLYGVPREPASRPLSFAAHCYARARVYDLRSYTAENLWGPFRDDGSQCIDWEKLESVVILLTYNLDVFYVRTDGRSPAPRASPFEGTCPNSYIASAMRPLRKEPIPPLVAMDPYNVTGEWLRVVCFLDYSELFAYNFPPEPLPLTQPRAPTDKEEAIRLIAAKVRITDIHPPGPRDGQALPVVHFVGKSKSMHEGFDPNANSSMRGSVRLTPEGEVRWTTFSVFHGEERWRSEGIQLGGRNSARGIWGMWFDKDYDPEGPAGPTAFWKLGDAVPDEDMDLVQF